MLAADENVGLQHHTTQKLADRSLITLAHPDTKQEVVLVEAASHMEDRTGNGLPDLSSKLKQLQPDAVILDMTKPAWQELSEEFAIWTGKELRHSIKLMDPIDLAGFNPPQWSTFDT